MATQREESATLPFTMYSVRVATCILLYEYNVSLWCLQTVKSIHNGFSYGISSSIYVCVCPTRIIRFVRFLFFGGIFSCGGKCLELGLWLRLCVWFTTRLAVAVLSRRRRSRLLFGHRQPDERWSCVRRPQWFEWRWWWRYCWLEAATAVADIITMWENMLRAPHGKNVDAAHTWFSFSLPQAINMCHP